MKVMAVINDPSSWKNIPNGTDVKVLGLSPKDARFLDRVHILNQVFTKHKDSMTLKTKKQVGLVPSGRLIKFSLGIKISYDA